MTMFPTDRATADTAATLIATFGDAAGREAAERADVSRNLGNAVGFCRWRQVERFVVTMASTTVSGTVH